MKNVKKPSFDDYYLSLAFIVAQRSIDPNTKCGCVIVSKDNRILSTGYNGPIKNSNDDQIPMVRPYKYYHMIHAEENALLSYNGSYQDIQNGTAYITNPPCHKCLRMLLQKGIKKLVHTNIQTKCVDVDDLEAQKIMLLDRNITIIVKDLKKCLDIVDNTKQYMLNLSNRSEI